MTALALNIGGTITNVDIAGFDSMTPDEQHSAASTAAQHISADATAAAKRAAAPVSGAAVDANSSYPNDLGQGARDLEGGVRATARLADMLPDGTPGKQTISDFGHAPQVFSAPGGGYTPATGRFTDAVRQGDYGTALSTFPHAALQALPSMVPALAVGATPAGIVGAGATIAAQNAGQNVEARATANNHATPSMGDLAGGLGTSAVEGAIGAGGLSPARLLPGIARLGLPARVAATVGAEGTAGAANSVVGQVGTSIGTDKGLSVDPAEVASAGLQQAGARGVSMLPGLARSGVQAGADQVMSRTMEQPATLEDAMTRGRTRTLIEDRTAAAKAAGQDTSPTTIANNVKSELRANLLSNLDALREQGLITPVETRSVQTVINEQALRHNNTIAEGGPEGPATLFDAVNKLNLPDEAIKPLVDGIRDLNTVSSQSFKKNQTGPFQQLGNVAGQAAGVGAGVYSMNPLGIAAAIAGHSMAGKLGGLAGRTLDGVFGTSSTTNRLKAMAADRMMKAAGVDEGGSSIEALQNSTAAIGDVGPALARYQALQATRDSNRTTAGDFAAEAERAQNQIDKNTASADKLKADQTASAEASRTAQNKAADDIKTSTAAALDKAQRIVADQNSSTTDKFLAGGKLAGEPTVEKVGAQTAAEISMNDQRLRNQAVVLKAAQNTLKVKLLAESKSIDGRAQASVDGASVNNATALAASQLAPSARSGVTSEAGAAAMAQAAMKAQRVRELAQQGGQASDRVAMGYPPADPVPVNTPINAPGQPVAPSPTPQPQVPQPQPQVPQAAPQGLPVAPIHPDNTVHAGWRRFAANGHKVTESDIQTAMDSAVADGHYTPLQGKQLMDNRGGEDNAHGVLPPLQEALGTLKSARVGLPGEDQNDRGPIRYPDRWAAAEKRALAHADEKIADAKEAGYPRLATTIRNIRDTSDAGAKATQRDEYLAKVSDQGEREKADELLSGPLMKGHSTGN